MKNSMTIQIGLNGLFFMFMFRRVSVNMERMLCTLFFLCLVSLLPFLPAIDVVRTHRGRLVGFKIQ